MHAPQIQLNKRHFQIVLSTLLVILVIVGIIITYPWLQLQLASYMMSNGNYSQAEQLLSRLSETKPHWTKPRLKLALSQLHLGDYQQAAYTVISLADSRLDDTALALIYMDVAEELIASDNGNTALELTLRLLTERPDPLMNQAAIEISFAIAQQNELPLAKNALDLALELAPNNWLVNQKAFNLLLTKALAAPAYAAEPALDRALELYPGDIIAVTRKASLLANREGARAALDFLVSIEDLLDNGINLEYLNTKRDLILKVAESDPQADLTIYVSRMPEETVAELAMQGLRAAWGKNISGEQFYLLGQDVPDVAYAYGLNLFQAKQYEDALEAFRHLEKLDPQYAPFGAIYMAIRAQTRTQHSIIDRNSESIDIALVSPNGTYLAYRRWLEPPWADEDTLPQLVLLNLTTSKQRVIGSGAQFSWSANGNWLAHSSISTVGVGSLQIHDILTGDNLTLNEDYSVTHFNWIGNTLFVQADSFQEAGLKLFSISPPTTASQPIAWDYTGSVNSSHAWVDLTENSLRIFTGQKLDHEIPMQNIQGTSSWSPNGRYIVVEGQRDSNWIYDYSAKKAVLIPTQGHFAAWGAGNQLYWYYPLWEGYYVLSRLNTRGEVVEYLPYTFDFPYYEISVTANGSSLVWLEDGRLNLSKR